MRQGESDNQTSAGVSSQSFTLTGPLRTGLALTGVTRTGCRGGAGSPYQYPLPAPPHNPHTSTRMLCSHSTPNYTQHTTSSSHLGVKVPVLRSLGPSHRHRAMLGPAFSPHVMQPSFVLLCFHCSRRCGEPHGRRAVGPSALCVEVRIVRGVPDVGSR